MQYYFLPKLGCSSNSNGRSLQVSLLGVSVNVCYGVLCLLLVQFIGTTNAFRAQPPPQQQQQRHLLESIHIRPASSFEEVKLARQILLQELMNPFSISQQHLLIAYQYTTATTTTTTTISSVNDTPVGIAERESNVVGFGQIRPLNQCYSEFASLYVLPQYRRMGIAAKLITTLLSNHDQCNVGNNTSICLLTLRPTVPLYVPHGFRVVANPITEKHDIPKTLALEFIVGTIISKILGNDLVCMIR
jgi:ribosomal protein S18 acetylase RimI-like enzyme